MDQLLDILGSQGTYRHFMLDGQSILVEDYLEMRPERAPEIARFVRLGCLAIGPWYVLPDEFLVAPESLVRNLMLGARTCDRFGNRMPVGYVPDPFGHVGQLPQIMQGFGIDTVAFRRGLAEEPAELWWEGPDKSRVLVCYLRDGYDNAAHLPVSDPDAFVAAIRTACDSLAPYVNSGHLLLLAGTDHQEPQPELPDLITYANSGRLGKDRLVHGSLSAYVEAVRESMETSSRSSARFPRIEGELRSPQRHHLLPGVLSARMWIKQSNEAIETLLTRWAEPLAAWAELVDPGAGLVSKPTGQEPRHRVRRTTAFIWHAWRLLLENHPHDSICGCSVDQVHREMASRFDQAEQIGQEVTSQSLRTIANQVATRDLAPSSDQHGPVQPLVVFNPTGGPRTDVVTARIPLPGAPDTRDAIEVISPNGQVVPHQVTTDPTAIESSVLRAEMTPAELPAYKDGQALNHELTFLAPDLPAYGYATFTVRPSDRRQRSARHRMLDTNTLENDLFRIQVDAADGTLALIDKMSGAVYSSLNGFVDGGDRGDEYNYCQPEEDRIFSQPMAPPTVKLLKDDPVRQVMEIAQVYRVPRSLLPDRRRRTQEGPLACVDLSIASRVYLYPGVRRVEIETTVDNQAQDHRLRVHFPVPVSVDHAFTEAHYYVARRPVPQISDRLDTRDWVEQPVPTVPQLGWAEVSDSQMGLLIANRGLPEVEFIPGDGQTVIALTLLRCVGWLSRDDLHCRKGHAGPGLPTPDAQCPGRHTFRYALIPHAGTYETREQARAQADAFRASLRAVAAEIHPGPLPPVASIIHVEPSSFVLTTVKQPEERSVLGLLVRGVNMSARPITVRLRPWREFERIARVNLNEEFLEPLLPETDGSVTISVRPWEIVSVRWREA